MPNSPVMSNSQAHRSSRKTPTSWQPRALAASVLTYNRQQFVRATHTPMYLLLQTRALSSYAVEQLVNRISDHPEDPGTPMTNIATDFVPSTDSPNPPLGSRNLPACKRVMDAFAYERAVIFPLTARADGSPLTLGRSSSNDIPVKHASVSKVHALFRYDKTGKLFIQEGGSKNGTVLDGVRIPENASAPLQSGACIGLGKVRAFVVEPDLLWEVLDGVLQ